MILRAPIIDVRSNLRLTHDSLDWVYSDHQTDTFKVDNVRVYQMFSMMFTDMDTFIYVKQRRGMQDDQAVFFDVHVFMALTMWLGRPKMQKESCKIPTMMAREGHGIGTSMLHSTKNSMPSWIALQIMAIVEGAITPNSTTSSKASRALSCRMQLILSTPN